MTLFLGLMQIIIVRSSVYSFAKVFLATLIKTTYQGVSVVQLRNVKTVAHSYYKNTHSQR